MAAVRVMLEVKFYLDPSNYVGMSPMEVSQAVEQEVLAAMPMGIDWLEVNFQDVEALRKEALR